MALASPPEAAQALERARPAFEVADVVRQYGAGFVKAFPTSHQQRAVLRALVRCRTAALGGHVEQCDACAHQRIAYNSCRNRHCPKCQGQQRARWMAAEQALLLPTQYFHVVFSLPHALNPLIRLNPAKLYGLLFQTAAATLLAFARDPKHLGAEPAITMVLHTWGQQLTEHAHVHCVVSGGGLTPDHSRWVAVRHTRRRRPFLFPVRALSKSFRRRYLAALDRLYRTGRLRFAGQSAALSVPLRWQQLLGELSHRGWVVYAKVPFGGPERVLKYLSRYTHRVAISNDRLLVVGAGTVRFHWKDYTDHHANKEMTLPAAEFLRRFLLHVLPRGFMRIRHYGIVANRSRRHKLARCRELLGVQTVAASEENHDSALNEAPDTTPERVLAPCPRCGGPMRVIELLVPQPHDTS